jgi:LmbE family N-acetylglucosaminyl deacetylase
MVGRMKRGANRILVIGAHPDDIEIGCGGTLAKMHDAGFILRGLILTRGEQGGNPAVRARYSRESAWMIGLNQLKITGFQDTRLYKEPEQVQTVLETVIGEFRPDLVLTHSGHDAHQDHVTVHEATLRACRNHSSILCYESPSVTNKFLPVFFVNVGEFVSTKLVSIQNHRDQLGKSYTTEEHIVNLLKFRGMQSRVKYAEGFEVVRLLASSWLGGF